MSSMTRSERAGSAITSRARPLEKVPFSVMQEVERQLEIPLSKDPEMIAEIVNRYSYFEMDDRKGYILSGKNENAPSYNQSFNYVGRKDDLKTVVFGFEYISLRYPYEDLSWLYDIDFELIDNELVDTFICIGPFAKDIAVRAYLSGISKDKIKTVEKVEEVYPLLKETKGNIYGILNLGTDKKVINELTKNGISVK